MPFDLRAFQVIAATVSYLDIERLEARRRASAAKIA